MTSAAEPGTNNGAKVLESLVGHTAHPAPVIPVTNSDCNDDAATVDIKNSPLLSLPVVEMPYGLTVQGKMLEDSTLSTHSNGITSKPATVVMDFSGATDQLQQAKWSPPHYHPLYMRFLMTTKDASID